MAKDFTNTQTGGEGKTPQVGDKPTESTELKKPVGRPTDGNKSEKPTSEVKGVDPVDIVGEQPKAEGEEVIAQAPAIPPKGTVKLPESKSSDTAKNKSNDAPSIPLESEKEAEIMPEEEIEEPIPLVAPIGDEIMPKPKFVSPFSENESDIFEDKAQNDAKFVINNEYNVDDYGDKIVSDIDEVDEGEPEKEPEVLSYPKSNLQYTIKDGAWYDRADSKSEWKKITERGRVYGLNAYHKKKVELPENLYKPKKGGEEIGGMKVYGYPASEGTAYTIKNGRWHEMGADAEGWTPVKSDGWVKTLNNYHGEKAITNKQYQAKGATQQPATMAESIEDLKESPSTIAGIHQQLAEASKAEPQRKIEDIEKAGDILQARGFELGDTELDVEKDSRGAGLLTFGTPTEQLFDYPDRPSDLIGARKWDEKYGAAFIPTGENVRDAEESKKTLVNELNVQLEILENQGKGEGHPEYQAKLNDYQPSLDAADTKIKEEELIHAGSLESFKTRNEYEQSEQYQIDKAKSPYYKLARIKEKMSGDAYGMYDPEAPRKMEENLSEMLKYNAEIGVLKLKNFTETDLDAWGKNNNTTESQLNQLKVQQELAKKIVKGSESGVLFNYESETMVYEVEEFMKTTTETNNRLAEAYNRGMDLTDVLVENKRGFVETNREMIGEDAVAVFESTLAMRDFISDYIDEGKVTIDPLSNVYSISEGVSDAEREYIDNQLGELIGNYQHAKNQIYSNNRKLISKKRSEIKSMEAAIALAKKNIGDGTTAYSYMNNQRIDSYTEKIKKLKSDVDELKTGENTIFLNDPNAVALDASKTSTTYARQVLQSMPDNITPKQKFDLFYESLLEKNVALGKEFGIDQSEMDRIGERFRDVVDWEYLGADLSPEEIDYYKNAATLRKLQSAYLNNDWGATEESAGFWSSLHNGMINTFAPQTSEAYGYFNETAPVSTLNGTALQLGFTDEDMASGMTYEQMQDRMDVLWYGSEGAGSMLGTTSAIMFALAASAVTTTGATKAGKGVYKLMKKFDKLDNITGAVKDIKRVEEAYTATMKSTKTGKFFYQTINEGLKFEVSGMLFNQDEELNFFSGMGGSMAGKGFERIFRNMPPSKAIEFVGGIFGANTDKAVEVFKQYGKGIRAMHYRGLGEMPEEFAQELIGIYRNELDGRGFWEVVNERYFEGEEGLSNLGQILVSSYALGSMMGTVMGGTQDDIIADLPEGEFEVVEKIIGNLVKDSATANANADITAGRIADNYDAVIEETVNPKRNKPQPKAEVEEDVKEEAVKADAEEVIDPDTEEVIEEAEDTAPKEGELVYQDGKVGTWKRMPESDTLFFEEKANMTESEIQAGIEAGNIRDMGAEAKVEPEVEVEPESTSLADKIRTLKVGDSMKGMATGTLVPPKVWDTVVEGAAITVETVEKAVQGVRNSDWYKDLRKNDPKKADRVDADLNKMAEGIEETGVSYKVPKTPTANYQQIKKKIATFKEGRTKGISEGKKLSKEESAKKKEVIEDIQNDIIEYARQNLPKTAYSSQKITDMMGKIKRATSMGGLNKAIEAVDKEMVKFEEQTRLNTADRLTEAFANPLTKKRGEKKVSKISVDSRKKLRVLAEEVGIDNLPNMTQEELESVEDRMDAIIDEGAESIKGKEQEKREERRTERAVPFKELAKHNNATIIQKEGKKDIDDFFVSKQGAVIYDNQLFTGKQAFEDYLKKKGVSYDSLGAVDAVLSRGTTKDAVRKFENSIAKYNKAKEQDLERGVAATAKRTGRRYLKMPHLRIQDAGKRLDLRMMDISKGSKALREWTKKNIVDAAFNAERNRENGRLEKLDELKGGMNNIFGKQVLTGIPKGWNKKSGVSIMHPNEANNLTKGQAVNVAMMLTSEPSMIYSVGDDYYPTKAQADAAAKNSGAEVVEVTDKYNPTVLIQISEDQSISGGLNKASELESFIEADPKLKAATELFRESYKAYRNDYEQIFTDLYDLEFKDGDYVPMTRSVDSELDTDLLANSYDSAASAMSSHLKQRHNSNSSNAEFDFTTDAYSKILNYVNTMEHAKHYLPVAENMRNLMNNTTKAQIVEKIGARNTVELKKHFDRILSDGKSTEVTHDVATRLAQYTVVTTLSGKLASIPKQLTSFTHYLGAGLEYGVGTTSILAQARKLPFALTGTSKKAADAGLLSDNDAEVIGAIFSDAFIRNRVAGKDIDTETRNLLFDLRASKAKNAKNLLIQAAMSPTILGDIGGVLTGGIPFTLAIYHKNVNDLSMSHEEAMDDAVGKFVRVSQETQQSQSEIILSNAQRDPVYRFFLTYTTSQVAAMSELTKAVKILTDRKGGYTNKEKWRARRKFGYYAVSNALFQIVASGAAGMYMMADDDDEREKELKNTALYNTVMDTVSSNLQGFGFSGKMADWVLNEIRNREQFNNIPTMEKLSVAMSTIGKYSKTSMDAYELFSEGEITFDEAMDALYWDVDQKTSDDLLSTVGLKNLFDSKDSWMEYAEADEDSKMTWWDAFMNRQTDEEGDVYKTGREREDRLYSWWFGDGEAEAHMGFPDDVQRQMEKKSNIEATKSKNQADIFAEGAEKGAAGNKEFTAYGEEVERKSRDKNEMLLRIKSMRAKKEREEKLDKYVEKVVSSKEAPSKVEAAKKEEKMKKEMNEWREIYKKDFGSYPPSGANITEIMNASIKGEQL